MADNDVVAMAKAVMEGADAAAAPETRGQKLWEGMNERMKNAFGFALSLVEPKKGEKIDPNVHGLLAELNLHIREVMYRVTDIANLVDRQDKHGERVSG